MSDEKTLRDTFAAAAWAVVGVGYEYVSLLRESAAEAARSGGGVMVPLYRHPQPTLTASEREAIKAAIDCCEDITYGSESAPEAAATLRGLLERIK